jgi:DNA-binding response OmpR family regulator
MAKRVLVVDDHQPTRTFVRAVLEADTYEVVEADSGSKCLDAFDAKGPFDLVMLDVGLPDMDGYAVCKALRKVDQKVPIIFVTGDEDFGHGRAAGSDSYIVKPIARATLRSTVMRFTSVG